MISSKRNLILNSFGCLTNALSSYVLLTVVTRFNGIEDGGSFSIAWATAQLLALVGYFDLRTIQVTDTKRNFRFRDYFSFRFLSTLGMIPLLLLYLVMTDRSGSLALLFFLLTFYRGLDCIADILEGQLQLEGRIDLSGLFLGTRVVSGSLAFIAVLAFSHNLNMAASAMGFVSLAVIIIFYRAYIRPFGQACLCLHPRTLRNLFAASAPLFIGNFLIGYVVTASRFAIDRYLSTALQNVYSFLLMPAFAINLFSLLIYRPIMTPMAEAWAHRDKKQFLSFLRVSLCWVTILSVLAIPSAYYLGIPIINLVSGLKLDAYRIELILLMAGGSMLAYNTVLSVVTSIFRKQFWVMICNGIGFLTAVAISPVMVRSFGLRGAALAYGIPLAVTAAVYGILVCSVIRKAQWEDCHE